MPKGGRCVSPGRAQARNRGDLQPVRVSAGDVGRRESLPRSPLRRRPEGIRVPDRRARQRRRRSHLGPDQRAFLLLARASIQLPPQLRPARAQSVARMADGPVRGPERRGARDQAPGELGTHVARRNRPARARGLHRQRYLRPGAPSRRARIPALRAGDVQPLGYGDLGGDPRQRQPPTAHHRGPGRGRPLRPAEPAFP